MTIARTIPTEPLRAADAWRGEDLRRDQGWIRRWPPQALAELDAAVAPVNNHVTYHARTAYVDDASAGRARLLFRLWLSAPNSRALPEGFEVLWGSEEPRALRGGIEQPG
jgi:hypothetical protein